MIGSGGSSTSRLLALAAGPAAGFAIVLLPFPGLTPSAHTLSAILMWVVLYWILEPIPLPITALLGTAGCVLAGLGESRQVFAAYSHPIIFLFIGSFLLAEAMAVHGVDRRVAAWMLSLPWIQARPCRILLALGGATAFVSMWISNTAATALMLPIAMGILGTLKGTDADPRGRYSVGLLLMLSYAATAGGMATVIGTPPNLIGVGLIDEHAGVRISFLHWMVVGVPLALIMLLTAWLLLWKLHPSPVSLVSDLSVYVAQQRRELGPWTRGQANACASFVVAMILWIVPGLLAAMLGPSHPLSRWLDTHLPNELVAILSAGLLFILPIDWRTGEYTLSWRQAANINWGVILLFGGGLAFGSLMVQTGLSAALGNGFMTVFGMDTLWGITAVAVAAGVLISELTSNTASASLLIPLVLAIAQAAHVSPVPPALGACLGVSMGFALPISTPPNAIVYGTGLIPLRRMIVTGLAFDLAGAILIWVVLRLLCPILGFA